MRTRYLLPLLAALVLAPTLAGARSVVTDPALPRALPADGPVSVEWTDPAQFSDIRFSNNRWEAQQGRWVAELARQGLQLFFLLPALQILVSWVRGLLINNRTTRLVNVGMIVNLVVTGLVLALGIWRHWPGIDTAAVALSAAAAVEFAFLWWQSRTRLGFRLTLADSRVGKG